MNNLDIYVYVIIALMPLAGVILVLETNPYHALVIRGILGAIAALVYALLGAADVALTEALVGTMLAITLYVVAVRSSLILRLGVIQHESLDPEDQAVVNPETEQYFEQLIAEFRKMCSKHYMRLEIMTYDNQVALQRALIEKEIHATCMRSLDLNLEEKEKPLLHTQTRIQRLYEIMQSELSSIETSLTYIKISDSGEKNR